MAAFAQAGSTSACQEHRSQLPKREQRLVGPAEPGIVVGFLSGTTSLGWNARQISDVTRSAGVTVYGFDVANAFAAEHLPPSHHSRVPPEAVVEGTATLLVCVNPDQFHYAAAFLPPAVFIDKYVIGWCVWELERIPNEWLKPLAMLDEIWVPSEFVRRAFIDSGVSLPFRIVPPQLDRPSLINPDRARFGIAAGRLRFFSPSAFAPVSSAKIHLPQCEHFKTPFPNRAMCASY